MKKRLDKEFKEWCKNEEFIEENTEDLKRDLVKELDFLSSMSVEEYTLYRKWVEIKRKYKDLNYNPFFDAQDSIPSYIKLIKDRIWMPESTNDYKKIKPILLSTKDKSIAEEWSLLKVFASTMINSSSVGRSLRFLVVDEKTGKYLGIICMSGDFLDLGPRDRYIGWSRETKTKKHMVNHTAIGSTIIPTQPLGYNYLGGKLLSLLLISRPMEDVWKEKYNDKLVGITTTSLYGSFSQYNNLKYWNKRGRTSGSIKYEPSQEIVNRIKKWLKYNHTRKYWEWYYAKNDKGMFLKRDYKQRSLSFVYSQLGITKDLIQSDHARGVYFCPLFTNTCEYLRMEIKESQLVRRFDNSVESLVNIWKDKYAKKRIEKLEKNGKTLMDTLFYDNLITLTWDETKEKYLGEIGR